ncbi:MAG: hypothetical protein ACK553_05685 [Planctomycetota bacterium]|jgi:hypothetical protein
MKNRWTWMWFLLLLVPLVGCRGCTQNTPDNAKDPKEPGAGKKKQRLIADELRTLPYATESPANMVKPGHWYQVRNKLKANFGDESLTASFSVTDKDGNPLTSGWDYDFMRNIALAVGQEKAIDATILHPFPLANRPQGMDNAETRTSAIRTRFTLRGIGTPILEESFPSKFLDGYQYDLVVMSRDLSRHVFWRGLDCIVWRRSDDLQENRFVPHRIVDIKEDELASHFPNRLATMTSISHVVVNDVSLSLLTQDQQSALADWLHFGGTIIINGPEAVASLETSQLKEWAPLINTSEGEWSENSQIEFDRSWTIRIAGGERVRFQSDRKIPILAGTLAQDANWLPMLDGLVAERLIGQGRVVMTTFPMTDAAFLQWPSYSSLIHNAILRKPHRSPSLGNDASTQFAGAYEGTERNPLHSTRLRLWARDLDETTSRTEREISDKQPEIAAANFPASKTSSLGAWNPNSTVIEQAVNCLRESSGITVPQVGTIMKLLLGYLVVLVPVNWLIFRLVGRVELAWIAAPVIAMLGAAYVARSVQLDVGFSRSQTSFGFLECHNGYPRGMLSNYYALYTSLSTSYQAVYKEGDGLVSHVQRSTPLNSTGRTIFDYWNADDRGSGLHHFLVLSNSTGMLQSEEMIDLSGPLRWRLNSEGSEVQVSNEGAIPIRDVGLLGIDRRGNLVMSWIGSVEPNESTTQAIQPGEENVRWFSQWDSNPLLKKPDSLRATDGMLWTDEMVEDVYMGAMLQVVAQRYPLQKGECIALGWTDANPSRLEISPSTVQKKHKTVVLMHVRSGQLEDVQPDTRIFANLNNSDE